MQLDTDICYQALLSRDARFDGKFFTAVLTTGIYCRPVCPARTPKRPNVRFYTCAAAAEDAGFRACRRCRPETAPWTPAWQGSSATVSRALRLVEGGAVDNDNFDRVADRLGISERQLRRLFVAHLGTSPNAVARTHRVHLARKLIDETSLPMTQVAFAAGFASVRNFNDAIRASFGATPSQLRAKRSPPEGGGSSLRVRLAYRPPLAWPTLLEFFAMRAIAGVEAVTAESYERTILISGKPAVITVRALPAKHQLELVVQGVDTEIGHVIERVRRQFDLGADPLPIAQQLGADPLLRPALRKFPGLRVPGCWDAFEVAVRAVVGQQVSVAAARTILGRLVERAGGTLPNGNGTSRLFPTAAQVAAAKLDSLGLTGARMAALWELARAVDGGQVDLEGADSERLAAQLCAIPGIGAWTAQYVAMRALGEPDVFLPADLVVRRVVSGGGALLSPRQVEARAESWRPWRAYAVICLWLNATRS